MKVEQAFWGTPDKWQNFVFGVTPENLLGNDTSATDIRIVSYFPTPFPESWADVHRITDYSLKVGHIRPMTEEEKAERGVETEQLPPQHITLGEIRFKLFGDKTIWECETDNHDCFWWAKSTAEKICQFQLGSEPIITNDKNKLNEGETAVTKQPEQEALDTADSHIKFSRSAPLGTNYITFKSWFKSYRHSSIDGQSYVVGLDYELGLSYPLAHCRIDILVDDTSFDQIVITPQVTPNPNIKPEEREKSLQTVQNHLVDLIKAAGRQFPVKPITKQSGIPSHLLNQLRNVLLECGPFDTDQELKAIFVEEKLSLWRNQIPQAHNPTERVERAIEFLYTRRNDKGENALGLFLHVLNDRLDKADACHQHITDLASELEHQLKSRNPKGDSKENGR